ncbi:MAG: hypothetical protein JWR76_369 [Mucilaginibacter sp.]|nr:hypothetical protein [Mucilaginibacter sp.]
MKVVLTPYYKDLFPGENDKLEDLLEGIGSVVILELLSMIDAELFSRDEGQITQVKIFELMLGRQTPEEKSKILENVLEGGLNDITNREFFSRHYNLTFMHYVLIHFREGAMDDLTPLEELNIFKAYFLVAQQFGQVPVEDKSTLPKFDEDYFAKMMWPSLTDSFEINFRTNPYFVMVRGIVLLNYLQFHSPYKLFVEQYLRKHGKVTNFNYALDIFNILNTNFESIREGKTTFASFTLGRSPGFDSLFDQFSLDIETYQQKYTTGKENYSGIKSRPLYCLDQDTWLVLNWSFLSNKLYEGLIFDFYNISGIAETKEFKQFTSFKQFIGEHVTEKHLFRLLARGAWQKKHEILLFDEKIPIGFPDVYYRNGNKVFLIEIKDAYFPSEAINSFSYDKIKSAIDKKLNNTNKGTGQLVKQLKTLYDQPFEKPQRYKKIANLEIYPIIIYTDIHFNMPGISEYVNRCFQEMVSQNGLSGAFRKIWPLTMININYLIGIFDVLKESPTSLDKQIEYFHRQINNRIKKHERAREIVNHQAIYDVFENVTKDLIKQEETAKKYIEWIVNTLNLKEGLPSE